MSALESLDRYLKELERKMRLAAWTRGVAALAFSALAATGLLVSYTNASAFAERDVMIARFVLFLVLALALTFGIVLPLLKVNRRRAARRAENVLPFGDRLLTVVEHRNESDPFLELIAADALPVAAANGTAAIVPSRQLILMGALAVMGVGSMWWLLQKGPGYWGYGANLLWFGPPKIEAGSFYDVQVEPGNKAVRKRSDVTVKAHLVGLQSPVVKLFARYRGASEWEQSPMMPAGTAYEFVFAGLPDTVEYYVQAGPLKSKTYTLTAVDLPGVKDIRVTYKYPPQLGLPPLTEEHGGDVRAVTGTTAKLEITFDRPISNGLLVVNGDETKTLQMTAPDKAQVEVKVEKNGVYYVAARELDENVRLTDDYFIEAQEDGEPVLKFRRPGRDAKVNPLEEVPVEVEASDDFGLRELTLRYSVNGGEEQTVQLLPGQNVKQANGKTLLTLESFQMQPGDVVSMYAVGRDARNTVQTDMVFVEAMPWELEYSQSQQGGGGGGGGGEQDEGKISARQKEIIAATWNQLRNRFADRKAIAENARFLSEMQAKLKDQAKSLTERMTRRELSGSNEEFKNFTKEMQAASAAMTNAVEKLKGERFKESLPHEQKALQHLMRAESLQKQIQVAFGSQGGGGGGGGGASRDLDNLFDLELDTEKNQYETGQQQSASNGDSREKQIDEAMQRLKELARRQQELAQQQRQNKQSFQQKWQQEQLRREAEELKKKLEELAQNQQGQQQQQGQQGQQGQQSQQSSQASGQQGGQSGQQGRMQQQPQQAQQQQQQQSSRDRLRQMAGQQGAQQRQDPRLQQALERLEQATKDMQRANQQSAGQSGAQQAAEAQRAAERLSEAQSALRGMRQEQSTNRMGNLSERANRLAEQQRAFADKVEREFGAKSGQGQDPAAMRGRKMEMQRELAAEKEKMAEESARLERDLQDASRQMQGSQRQASSKLREAVGQMQQDQVTLRNKMLGNYYRQGLASYLSSREQSLAKDLEKLRKAIEGAQQSMDPNAQDGSKTERSLAGVEKLREQLQQMVQGQRGQNGQRGQQQGQGQQGQGSRAKASRVGSSRRRTGSRVSRRASKVSKGRADSRVRVANRASRACRASKASRVADRWAGRAVSSRRGSVGRARAEMRPTTGRGSSRRWPGERTGRGRKGCGR
jgi:hypothetical protein